MATDSTKTLSQLREQRRALDERSIQIESTPSDQFTEKHLHEAEQVRQDMEALNVEISKAHLREARTAPMIAPQAAMGRPQEQVNRFSEWLRSEHRTEHTHKLETRALAVSNFGGVQNVAVPEFIARMSRDSVVFGIANVTQVSDGAPRVFYAQSAQGSATVAAEAATFGTLENGAATVTITPSKSTALSVVSREALTDLAWDVEAEVLSQHSEAHAAFWESQFLRDYGDAGGVTQNGVQTMLDIAGGTGWINQQTASVANATTISMADAAAVIWGSSLATGYKSSASWLINPAVWANTFTQSGSAMVMSGQSGEVTATQGAPLSLLGYPVRTSSQWPAQQDAEPRALFGDFRKGYRIVVVAGVDFAADPYTLAASGQVRFSSYLRVGAKIVDRYAVVASNA